MSYNVISQTLSAEIVKKKCLLDPGTVLELSTKKSSGRKNCWLSQPRKSPRAKSLRAFSVLRQYANFFLFSKFSLLSINTFFVHDLQKISLPQPSGWTRVNRVQSALLKEVADGGLLVADGGLVVVDGGLMVDWWGLWWSLK